MRQLEDFKASIYDLKGQLKRHVYDRSLEAFDKGDVIRDQIKNIAQLKDHQKFIKEEFMRSIGGLPSSDTPLNPKITGTNYYSGYRIEKVIFESRPKHYVTTNLYIPDGVDTPQGAVLFLCGHSEEAKFAPHYQTVCQYLVQSGLVVLAMDPLGQGERFGYYEKEYDQLTVRWGTTEHDYVGSQCLPLGHSLARYFLHDAMRAVDYLCTRKEVDPNKIGVTGTSGGGTQTSMMMMCDPRIAAAAPSTFIMNRRSYMFSGQAQDKEQIWPGFSAKGLDHEDIVLAMAPRPVRVLAVKYDFFPIEGARRTVERTKRFWNMLDADQNLDMVEDAEVHMYSEPLARAAAEFFAKHLLNKETTFSDTKIETRPTFELWSTSSGQVRADYPDSKTVHNENVARLKELKQKREEIPRTTRKQNGIAWLKDKVMYARKPCEWNPRHKPLGLIHDLEAQSSIWWAQEGLFNHAFLFKHHTNKNQTLPLTIAVWNGGTKEVTAHSDWIRSTCANGRAVLVLDMSGVGASTPEAYNSRDDVLGFYGAVHKLADDLLWLDDSLAALRIYEVVRAIEFTTTLENIDETAIQLYTTGSYSLYARLAKVLSNKVTDIEHPDVNVEQWVGARHYNSHDINSVILPGMLEYFDLDDLDDEETSILNTTEL